MTYQGRLWRCGGRRGRGGGYVVTDPPWGVGPVIGYQCHSEPFASVMLSEAKHLYSRSG